MTGATATQRAAARIADAFPPQVVHRHGLTATGDRHLAANPLGDRACRAYPPQQSPQHSRRPGRHAPPQPAVANLIASREGLTEISRPYKPPRPAMFASPATIAAAARL